MTLSRSEITNPPYIALSQPLSPPPPPPSFLIQGIFFFRGVGLVYRLKYSSSTGFLGSIPKHGMQVEIVLLPARS